MMADIENITENIRKFVNSGNLDSDFSKSILFNPDIDSEVDKVYERTLNNLGKLALSCFQLNLFHSLEEILKNTNETGEFVEDITEVISDYFDKYNSNLDIKSTYDLNELLFILELTSILLVSAEESNDLEILYESFFQIES